MTSYFIAGFFALLAVILLYLLFSQRNNKENGINELMQKYDELMVNQHRLEQEKVKAETELTGIQTRLAERDTYLANLEKELNAEKAQQVRLNEQINHFTSKVSKAETQVTSLQQQLDESQKILKEKDQNLLALTDKNVNLAEELATLKTSLAEKEEFFVKEKQMLEENKKQQQIEFQNLANKILEEKSQKFSQTNQAELSTLLKPFREQIEGFQKRVNEIHSDSVKGNAGLEAEIKKLLQVSMSMSQEANNLSSALKGEKKTLGNWGEMQLERTLQLAGLEPGVHYVAQEHFKDADGKNAYPDFVLHLPDNKHMIIDSKMSLVAYDNAIGAEDEVQRNLYLNEHCKALRKHMDDLAKKDYSNLDGVESPNFVLMFVSVEPAYIEAMKNDHELFNYGYQRNVILVSHTTLMPILRTVANLWRLERGNAEAKEITERAADIYNQLCVVTERFKKVGNTLNTACEQYNDTIVALAGKQGLIGKVEKFQTLSAKANKNMPTLDVVEKDVNVEKLELFLTDKSDSK